MKIKDRSSISSSNLPEEVGSEVRRFGRALAIICAPFVLIAIAEIAILPMDKFTFRVWEAVSVKQMEFGLAAKYSPNPFAFSGPLYPNVMVAKEEVGDLDAGTQYAVKKQVEWRTDDWGYRASGPGNGSDIVMVGDSLVVGSSLTQSDTMAEVLAGLSGKKVYPMGPSSMNLYLNDNRFAKSPPKTVILCVFERNLVFLGEETGVQADEGKGFIARQLVKVRPLLEYLKHNPAVLEFNTVVDRLVYSNLLSFLRTRLSENGRAKDAFRGTGQKFFLYGAFSNQIVPEETIQRVAGIIAGYKDLLSRRGTKFLFAPLPNKETVYYRWVTPERQPDFLPRLMRELRKRGVASVDLQTPYTAFTARNAAKGVHLYHMDDTHWNPMGVKMAAQVILNSLPKN